MRILWSSNSPFCLTGYGQTTASCTINLKKMGHDVAIFAFYGLEGSQIDWFDIPIYPNSPRDWGIKNAKLFYDHYQADILVTLVDVWVLGQMDPKIRWVAIVPIDHDPVPPQVVQTLTESRGLIKILVESRFGQKQLKEHGLEADYISHPTDTDIFAPRKEWRDLSRNTYKWQDKFVIGTVGTNHNERKNWVASLKAVKEFEARHKGEIVYYMHTNPVDDRGVNLIALRDSLGVKDFTFLPKQVDMEVGIDRATLARAYNCMDVFLLPSKGEGFGVPLIEAQACAVPIITTKCTAQEELMGGGWFIENLVPVWDQQSSWHFECHHEEIVERLEQAYQAKKDGSIEEERAKARLKALEYKEEDVFANLWKPLMDELQERIDHPERFKGRVDYKRFYEIMSDRQETVEDSWAKNPEDPINLCGVWHEKNRTDISARMLGDFCKGKRVLAVGAAREGEATLLARIDAGEVVRTDIIPNPEKNIIGADVEKLPFGVRSFDVVICRELLEHVIDEKKAMREMSRVLKRKGYLFITVPNILSLGMDGLEHVRGWSPKEFIEFVENSGFKIVDKRGNLPNLFVRECAGLYHDPQYLPEFQEMSKGFDENPLSYFVSTQLFVLAQKRK